MKKAIRFLFSLYLLLTLASGCNTESFIELANGGAVAFTVTEGIADLSTKSAPVSAVSDSLANLKEEVILTSAAGDTLILEMMQELMPDGLLKQSEPHTKAKIYRSSDETPLQGDPFAVWSYVVGTSANAKPSANGILYPSNKPLRKAKYDASKKYWRPVDPEDNTDPFKDIPFIPSQQYENQFARWYAIAPWSAVSTTTLPLENNKDPKLNYTVTDGSVDLMAAVSASRKISDEYKKTNPPIVLTFGHLLTAVRFKKDNDAATDISSITFNKLYYMGTLDIDQIPRSNEDKQKVSDFQEAFLRTFDEDNLKGAAPLWELVKDAADNEGEDPRKSYTLNFTSSDWTPDAAGTYAWTGDDHVLMLMPQWLPDGASIVAQVNGKPYEGTISGHHWLPGRMVTYRIKKASPPDTYRFEIENELGDLSDYENGNGVRINVIVKSGENSTEHPYHLGWRVQGIYHTREAAEAKDANDPIMRTEWNAVRNGDRLNNIFIPGATTKGNYTSEQLMKNSLCAATGQVEEWIVSRGTEAAPWNLSNPAGGDKIVESANTYIINDPGWYKIPLVMGNGIVNGNNNPPAFNASNFKNYKDNAITDPWLHNNGGTPTSAFVVWEEEKVMTVQDETSWELPADCISTDASGNYWLKFQIDKDKMKPGCAVIAVRDNNNDVMWSWTLWLTDFEPGSDDDIACTYNTAGNTVTFMPRNLGWTVKGTMTAIPKEQVYVRVQVSDNDDVYAIITVRRPASVSEFATAGYSPYYQWGRKDALIPSTGSADAGLAVKGGMNRIYTRVASDGSLATLILHPENHYKGDNNFPLRNDYKNYWSADATAANGETIATKKTIYDPCPAGYSVPRHQAFDGFVMGTGVSGPPNASGSFVEGYAFNTAYRTSSTTTIYFPAAGRNNANDSFQNVGTQGHYWTAIPQIGGTGTARSFNLQNGTVVIPSTNSSSAVNKAMSLSVRPARAEQ